MNKVEHNDDMRKEYNLSDLGKGVQGKYYDAYSKSHNVVLLKPEVAKSFPTDEAVNEALLSLISSHPETGVFQ